MKNFILIKPSKFSLYYSTYADIPVIRRVVTKKYFYKAYIVINNNIYICYDYE